MSDIEKAVDEMRRVLKAGGLALVVVPSNDNKAYKDSKSRSEMDCREVEKGTISYREFEGDLQVWHNYIFHFFSEKEMKRLFKNFKFISLEHIAGEEEGEKFWVLVARKKYSNLS